MEDVLLTQVKGVKLERVGRMVSTTDTVACEENCFPVYPSSFSHVGKYLPM